MEKGFIIYFVGNLISATVALLLYRHHMKREKEEHKRERQREERCICDFCGHLIQKTVDDSGTAHRICDSREFILGDKAVEICTRYERRNDIGAGGGGSGGQRPDSVPVSYVSYEEWLEKELQK